MMLNAMLDTTSLIIVGIFFLVTLIVGLYAGRNVKDFKDYVLGGRRFNTITLILTFLATDIGGYCVLGYTNEVYKFGIIAFSFWIGLLIQNLLIGFIVSPKYAVFKNCFTIGDLIGKGYGKNAKLITGLLTAFKTLCICSIQLVAIGKILNIFFNLNPSWAILISGIILTIYTSLGGIKSVTYTDVIQFLSIILVLALISTIFLQKAGGLKKLFSSLPAMKFQIYSSNKFISYSTYFIFLSIGFTCVTSPSTMQRIFMAKSSKQIKNMFIIGGICEFIFGILITVIGLSIFKLYPAVASQDKLLYIINIVFSKNILKIFIICGLIAIILSSADSFLHSVGIIITNDILKNIFDLKKRNTVLLCKITTFISGLFIIVVSIKLINLSSFRNLFLFKSLIILPILLIPILTYIIGIKNDKKYFYISGLFSTVITIVSYIKLAYISKTLAISIGILVNLIIFLITHFIQNKGIAIINRDYDQNKPQRIWKPTWQGFLETLFSYIPTPHKIFEFSRKSVSRCGANNMLFGIFVCINFIVPYFMWDHKNEDLYNLMIYLRFFGGLLGGLLIVKSEWKDFLKPYFPLFWHFTLLYCLPFISTVMFLLTNGSIIWLLNIGTSIFFLIMLTENIVFLTLTPIGIVLGILFYILRVGPVDLSSFGFEVNYQLIYQVLFSSTIGLLFSYRKKIFNSIKGNEGTNLGLAMCHELRNTGLYIYPAAQISLMYLKKYRNNFKEINKEKGYFIKEKDFEYIKEQNQEIERLGRLQKNIVGTFEKLLKEYRDSINDPQNFSMKYIINQAIDQYIFKPGQKEKLDINLNKDFIAKIPKQVFIFVVDNIIRNSYKHGNPSKIKIWLEENELHIKDNGKGISEREMDLIFKMYFTNGDSSSSGIGLAFAKQIVEGFGGEIWVESQTGSSSYTEFIIKFPKVSEELSEEEIKENMELEIKKNIAKTMKEEGVEKKIIEKSIGISTDDLQDDE